MDTFKEAMKTISSTVVNGVVTRCMFQNDTMYEVLIIDYDGTRCLKPGETDNNFLVRGFGAVDLVMKFGDEKEVKVRFPSSRYENRCHKLSLLFQKEIQKYGMENKNIHVERIAPVWRFIYCHPGGFDQELETEIVREHNWSKTLENETELSLSVKAVVKAIELSSSFKQKKKLTRVDQFKEQLTQITKQKFNKDPCYLWQEIVVVDTNQRAPLDKLEIPTPHIERTSTPNEPSKNRLIYDN